MSPTALRNVDAVEIVDIHQDDLEFSLVDDLYKSLNPEEDKPRSFPTLLLYDTRGLKIFEKITYLDEYYLTNAEIEVLTIHAKRIVERIPENAQLVELGSGNLRKIEILLRECERVEKQVDYYALDLSLVELQRTFSEISPEGFNYVGLHGLHGTYDDALLWLKNPENRTRPTVVLSMGSSLGNFDRAAAADFLGGFSKALGPADFLLIGLDACKTPEKVYRAYNDSQGVTQQFYENGLAHANSVLGFEAFKASEWEIITGYDKVNGRHQAFYSPKVDVTINDIQIPRGEKLIFEEAYKYGIDEREELCRNAGLISQVVFGNSTDDYHVHLLSPASLNIPLQPSQYAAHPVPTLEDFQSLWTVWDVVTKTMIPREELLSKPIKLRNALIFYLGHIPTFFDIHLTRALCGKPTDPKYYKQIFERGIDPDVENPEQCHAHSEIPDEWPPLDEILDYSERVRNRARSILEEGSAIRDRCLGEALWIGFEHEAMHLETFLYMLLQSEKTLPPIGVETPNFEKLALDAKENERPNTWFRIPQQSFTIGLDDSDDNVLPKDSFGWDNEKPQRSVHVHAFEAQARPVTNGEYAKYLQAAHLEEMPASWTRIHSDQGNPISKGFSESRQSAPQDFMDNFAVRTVFGPVSLDLAQDWPVIASYDELARHAKWTGCRIPSHEEVRSIYLYADQLRGTGVRRISNSHSNGTNGTSHGVNGTSNGVKHMNNGTTKTLSSAQTSVFRALDGSNVGFQNWHPVPVTPNGDKLAGQGDLGGVWEWTSTPLTAHEGFKAMEIYPGYTSDFFDGKHNIIQGGSWATMPRIAGRTTFVNWYQHNYLYAWAGARLRGLMDVMDG
ncbi:Ergothioneine biosynthesis protein 1 [Penicillium cataractarum]|uniref:Ergothioneine biosynthesis protein 1 n=1 Tax=Penicillium cataractarum TaxID=2100454 RepID=A0A9W9V701_9EURO|nr:Ergothioneine biosynthesis protein 1 [Penicillium cataractarum]KAJ5371067.1 Ergothioneine biosynthesis protein 1 [Penicillium cataractarum]